MFIVVLGAVLALMHLYVWKRLIKDTSRGRARMLFTALLAALLLILVTTLVAPRLVGDLVDGTAGELGSAAEPLRDLASREGVFFVTGNHEYFVDDTASWLRELERLGVQPLRNENTAIRRKAAAFDLAGVNDVAGGDRSDPPDFDRALSGVAAAGPTVLLAHQPIQVAEAAKRGVDLQLSGHTHGGQLWPFHYVVNAVQPSLAGLSAVNDTQLYVTRGAGFWGPPVRVGARPDITVIGLQSGP